MATHCTVVRLLSPDETEAGGMFCVFVCMEHLIANCPGADVRDLGGLPALQHRTVCLSGKVRKYNVRPA